MKMKGQKNKPCPSNIGRRTGINVVQGKLIRRREDGTDVYDDYWTDSESVHSDKTSQSMGSPNKTGSEQISSSVSILNRDAVNPMKPLRSSLKKTVQQRSGESEDYNGDSSPERSKRSGVSKKKSLKFFEDVENATIARSKMTQTSHLLDETESSPSKNRTYLKEIRRNRADLSDSEKNSSIRRSPRVLSDTSCVQNRREDLVMSTDDTNAASVSLSHKIESGKKTKDKSNSMVDEAEDSPSKNRTYTQASYLKETGGKKGDLSDSERNSPVERPRVLSNTSSLPNIREKGNNKNSSGGRSHCATESSEVLNEEENILSRSVNRSGILVSTRRESGKKEDKRKSSIGKSPIAVKRKMQTPKATENRLSKTPRVQNRGGDGNKKDSPGGRSSQLAAKSSEMLNQIDSIPSRNNEIVNSSEILVSNQKESEQKSSVEKSPRVSTRNMMQVSNTTDLHMKAVSPVHSARRKIVFSETRKDTLQENEPAPYSVKRSSRMRFPPLASWRNERPKFVKTNSGEIKCIGIDKGLAEDDYAIRTLNKKLLNRKKIQKPKASGRKNRKNIINLIGKTAISDAKNGNTIELNLHRPFSSCEWTLPMNDDSPSYMISRVFSSRLMTFGFLDIAGHSMKDKQFSPSDNVHFVVIKGVADVVIGTTSFTFNRGDSFIVPVGTGYCVSNNTSSSVLLNFCAFKIPFFRYQEED